MVVVLYIIAGVASALLAWSCGWLAHVAKRNLASARAADVARAWKAEALALRAVARGQAATIDLLRADAIDAAGVIERQREKIAELLIDNAPRARGYFGRMQGRG